MPYLGVVGITLIKVTSSWYFISQAKSLTQYRVGRSRRNGTSCYVQCTSIVCLNHETSNAFNQMRKTPLGLQAYHYRLPLRTDTLGQAKHTAIVSDQHWKMLCIVMCDYDDIISISLCFRKCMVQLAMKQSIN